MKTAELIRAGITRFYYVSVSGARNMDSRAFEKARVSEWAIILTTLC